MATKLNGWTKMIIAIVSVIFMAGVAYTMIYVNSDRIGSNRQVIEKLDGKVEVACKEVTGLQKDVYYIKEKVDNNAKVQQQILDEIRSIRHE